MGTIVKHASLLLFGVVLAVSLLEAGLRVASVAVRTVGERSQEGRADAERTVLCVGDSHTYGAPLPREESYPSQLAEYLAAASPGTRWRVLNRGVPGMNAAQVAALLEAWILQHEPDLVVVWVGANNFWNRADPAGIRTTGGSRGLAGWLASMRIVKLYRAFAARADLDDWEAEEKSVVETWEPWFGADPMPPDERFKATLTDLSHIADTLTQYRIPWLLVTYPLVSLNWHERVTDLVARHWKAEVVHTSKDLSRAQREIPEASLVCPWPPPNGETCLFVNAMGPHPTKLLYAFIAESIGEVILKLLRPDPQGLVVAPRDDFAAAPSWGRRHR